MGEKRNKKRAQLFRVGSCRRIRQEAGEPSAWHLRAINGRLAQRALKEAVPESSVHDRQEGRRLQRAQAAKLLVRARTGRHVVELAAEEAVPGLLPTVEECAYTARAAQDKM